MRLRLDPPAILLIADVGLKDHGDGTRQAGRQIGPLAIIHPDYAGDLGLIAHEQEHVAQWLGTGMIGAALAGIGCGLAGAPPFWFAAIVAFGFLGLHHALYAAVPAYRLWAELDAYRTQAAWYVDDRRPLFARFLAERYGLGIREAEALARLGS